MTYEHLHNLIEMVFKHRTKSDTIHQRFYTSLDSLIHDSNGIIKLYATIYFDVEVVLKHCTIDCLIFFIWQ